MFNYFKNDLKAGIVVFLVALPLCLGIALSQGVPLFSGIISGIIGGIVVASISKSNLSVSGPAAGLTAVVLASIDQLGSFQTFLLAVSLAGLFQIILGIARAGIIGHYIPSSVIKGMLASIGLILISKQIPHFFGYDRDPEGDEEFAQVDGQNTFSELLNMLDAINPGALTVATVSLFILILWQLKPIKSNRYLNGIPAPLLAVVAGTLTNELFQLTASDFAIPSSHLVNLPEFHQASDITASLIFPDFSQITNGQVYWQAFILAAVASLETLLNVEAVDKLDPENYITPTNRELIAQGTGNVFSGLLGGIPITSVIVRSAANVSAGGKTRLSSILHGLLFIITILFIPGILEMIPLSALAAILIFTGFKLTMPRLYKSVYKLGMDQFIPFIITIVVFLRTDLLIGVSCGLTVSVIFILRQNYRNPYKMVSDEIEGRKHFFIKLSQNVTFINKGKIVEVLHKIPKGSKVYIDGGRTSFIDKDVLEVISEFKRSAPYNNIEVSLEDVQEVELLS